MNYVKNRLNKLHKLLAACTLVLMFFLAACSGGPQPINYGQDGCAFCKMTISDERFGAEIVTQKGKIFKFDATECMLGFVNKAYVNKQDVAQYLVVDATNPTVLIPADKAQFLISEKLPSPMGGNVSAFALPEKQESALAEFGGEKHDWNSIINKFSKQ
ncbi:MAG: nitrous oxide reductase accessory protein NosL [Bacteroidia bacterium]